MSQDNPWGTQDNNDSAYLADKSNEVAPVLIGANRSKWTVASSLSMIWSIQH